MGWGAGGGPRRGREHMNDDNEEEEDRIIPCGIEKDIQRGKIEIDR